MCPSFVFCENGSTKCEPCLCLSVVKIGCHARREIERWQMILPFIIDARKWVPWAWVLAFVLTCDRLGENKSCLPSFVNQLGHALWVGIVSEAVCLFKAISCNPLSHVSSLYILPSWWELRYVSVVILNILECFHCTLVARFGHSKLFTQCLFGCEGACG